MLDTKTLEKFIEERMVSAHVPGAAVAVVHHDMVVYSHGFGVTGDGESSRLVTQDTIFRIGSVTKPLTGTMIMRLVEAGTLDLDTPITRYVPDLRLDDPDAAGKITLRHLLSHTSGLGAALNYHGWRDPGGLAAYVRDRLPKVPVVAPPGRFYLYSNPGLNLAGYVAEVATGVVYDDLMAQQLFAPLGMNRTTFDPLVAMTYPFSQSFELNALNQPLVKRPFIDNSGEHPCGFAMSTVRDLAQFMRLHLNRGEYDGQPLLRPDSVAQMHGRIAELYTHDERAYGLTFRTRPYKTVQIVGHNGAIGKFGAVLAMVPEREFGIVLVFNRGPQFWGAADNIVNQTIDQALGLDATMHTPAQIIEPDRTPWQSYRGAYLGAGAGLALVDVEDDQLWLTLNGERLRLEGTGSGRFIAETPAGARLSAAFLDSDSEKGWLMVDGMLCYRMTEAPKQAEITAFAPYVGIYEGDLDRWRLRVDQDALWLYSEDERSETRCVPLETGLFSSAFGLFRIEADAEGRPVALLGGGGDWRYPFVGPLDKEA